MPQKKFLLIQTAFIGDVVLATGLIEKLHQYFPGAQIDFMLRKGNENLFDNHPFLHEIIIWNKQKNKYQHLLSLLKKIRHQRYDTVINVQRFAATGFVTAFSGAKQKIGFNKNPWSFLFSIVVAHKMSSKQNPIHEIDRNNELIKHFTDNMPAKPRLYPSAKDYDMVKQYQHSKYVCVAPASVWFTKQYPAEKWISFINKIDASCRVLLLGGPNDKLLCEQIKNGTVPVNSINLAGKLSFLQAAALQQSAVMNYVNDSAPMHFASAVNAPVTAVYCSTVPAFGFGPLSDQKFIIETAEPLTCKPCGVHGHATCPEKHFKCALTITDEQLLHVFEVH